MTTSAAWVNGEIVDPAAATIPLMSAAVFRGTSVFDVMLVVDGMRAVGLDAHFDRLFRSAAEMGHQVAYGAPELRAAVAQVMAGQPTPAIVRTVVADGGSSGHSGAGSNPIVAMSCEPAELVSAPLRLVSADAKIAPEVMPADIKVAAIYAPGLRVERRARSDGADGIVNFSPDGRLLEAVSASVGVVTGGRLLFPPIGQVLDSVTRRLVVDVAAAAGIEVVVETVSVAAVRSADALFVASATRPVVAVSDLDGVAYDVGDATVAALREGVDAVFSGRHPLSDRWLTALSGPTR